MSGIQFFQWINPSRKCQHSTTFAFLRVFPIDRVPTLLWILYSLLFLDFMEFSVWFNPEQSDHIDSQTTERHKSSNKTNTLFKIESPSSASDSFRRNQMNKVYIQNFVVLLCYNPYSY